MHLKTNQWYQAVVLTLLAQIIWGVAAPLVKFELQTIPPFSLLFLRCLFTALFLFPIYEWRLLPKQPDMTRAEKLTIFWAGFTGVFLNLAFYFFGQRLTTVIDAFVIISLGTPLLLLYSFIYLKERLARPAYLGVGLAFVGSLIIIGSPLFTFGNGSFFGNLLALAATISACVSYLLIKKLVVKFDPLLLTFYFFLTSLVASTPFLIWEFLQNPYWLAQIASSHLVVLGYLVFGSSIAAYYLTSVGLRHLPASLASTLGYTSTIVAVALGIIVLHEKLTWFFAAGAIFIILGLFLAETHHRRKLSTNT